LTIHDPAPIVDAKLSAVSSGAAGPASAGAASFAAGFSASFAFSTTFGFSADPLYLAIADLNPEISRAPAYFSISAPPLNA